MDAHVDSRDILGERTPFIGLFAGFVAGLIGAVVARVLMRVIALLIVGHGSFSVEGTANIIIFGALVGPLFGLIYRSTLYKMRAPELVKGLLFGLTLAITVQVPGLLGSSDFAAELMSVGPLGPLGLAIFVAMNFAFVLTLAGLTAWLERVWPNDESRTGIQIGMTTAFGLLALIGCSLLATQIVGGMFSQLK